MGLEALLKAFRWLDEKVLTQYTKLYIKLESLEYVKNYPKPKFLIPFGAFGAATLTGMMAHILLGGNNLEYKMHPIEFPLAITSLAIAKVSLPLNIHDSFYTFSYGVETPIKGEIAIESKFNHYSRENFAKIAIFAKFSSSGHSGNRELIT